METCHLNKHDGLHPHNPTPPAVILPRWKRSRTASMGAMFGRVSLVWLCWVFQKESYLFSYYSVWIEQGMGRTGEISSSFSAVSWEKLYGLFFIYGAYCCGNRISQYYHSQQSPNLEIIITTSLSPFFTEILTIRSHLVKLFQLSSLFLLKLSFK